MSNTNTRYNPYSALSKTAARDLGYPASPAFVTAYKRNDKIYINFTLEKPKEIPDYYKLYPKDKPRFYIREIPEYHNIKEIPDLYNRIVHSNKYTPAPGLVKIIKRNYPLIKISACIISKSKSRITPVNIPRLHPLTSLGEKINEQ